MDGRETRLDVLIPGLLEELRRVGLSEANIWSCMRSTVTPIRRYFASRGLAHYDNDVMDDYVRDLYQQRDDGIMTRDKFNDLMRGADRLQEYCLTGKVTWRHRPNGTRFEVSSPFEEAIEGFIATASYTDNTKGDVRWTLHKYLSFAEQRGRTCPASLKLEDIEAFMVFCSKHLKGGSLSNVKGYIKAFHRHLRKTEVCHLDAEPILSFPIRRETRISPFATAEEIEATLAQVNRTTVKGLRDYAIIVLAATTGMRAGDIVSLRLSDIDWATGTIKVSQSKTGRLVTLPLVRAAGEAISAYILEGRPEAATDHVFLTACQPYRKLSGGCPVADMYNKYQSKAGIERTAHDGKGFHAIRRAMGRSLVVSGVPVTAIAQILGQSGTQSVKPYISLATADLRQCALSLDGLMAGEVA